MPAPIPESTKLAAIAFTIAGLNISDAAKRLNVSPRSLGEWSRDKALRRKAVQLYMRAVEAARATRRECSKREARIREEMKEASAIAKRPIAYRRAKAVGEAKDRDAQRKVVIVNQTVVAPQVEEEDEQEMLASLKALAAKFQK